MRYLVEGNSLEIVIAAYPSRVVVIWPCFVIDSILNVPNVVAAPKAAQYAMASLPVSAICKVRDVRCADDTVIGNRKSTIFDTTIEDGDEVGNDVGVYEG